MRIALITPELHTLVRRTNLAGVSESLAKALHGSRQDVRVFLPWTRDVDPDALGELNERAVLMVKEGQGGSQRFRVVEGRLGELPIYLFDNEALFAQRYPYGGLDGPYPENWRRYALFSLAVLQSFE